MSSGHVFLDGLGVAGGILIRSLQLFNAGRHGLELTGWRRKGVEDTPKGCIDFHLTVFPPVWKTFVNYQQRIAGIYLRQKPLATVMDGFTERGGLWGS